MPQDVYYRYFSHPAEINQPHRERVVHTTNPDNGGKTWFTPTRYQDPNEAQRLLALAQAPQYRVGPIQADTMPVFNVRGPQRIQPAYGHPGGGIEVCTTEPIYLFGCYNFASSDWEPL